jgi:hypothetical protein
MSDNQANNTYRASTRPHASRPCRPNKDVCQRWWKALRRLIKAHDRNRAANTNTRSLSPVRLKALTNAVWDEIGSQLFVRPRRLIEDPARAVPPVRRAVRSAILGLYVA